VLAVSGEDPAAVDRLAQVQLTLAIQDVPDLRPRDQVAAMEDRHGGEVLEGRDSDVVVLAHAADGRIWVEAGDDRITARRVPYQEMLSDLS
jgi:hypothetical protein